MSRSSLAMVNCLPEIKVILQAANELPGLGEKKVTILLCGYIFVTYIIIYSLACPVDSWFKR